jgi:hypothetical protein
VDPPRASFPGEYHSRPSPSRPGNDRLELSSVPNLTFGLSTDGLQDRIN